MSEILWAWFNDSLVQSTIISPLIGALFGVLLSGLNAPSASSSGIHVHHTTVINRSTTVINRDSRSSPSGDDGWTYPIVLLLLGAAVVWGYSAYSSELLRLVLSIVLASLAFVTTAALISLVQRYPRNMAWYLHIAIPVACLCFCVYLVHLAHQGIIPNAREIAQRMGVIPFYTQALQQQHRDWILFQAVGVGLLVVAAIVSACGSLYYLAVINAAPGGRLRGVWTGLASLTNFMSGWWGATVCVALTGLAFVCVSGYAYSWIA